MTFWSLMRKPGAFSPLAMSFAALALIAVALVTVGNDTHAAAQHDEGTPARIFQLLILLQAPISAVFAVRWLPCAPRPALFVLLLQVGVALLPVATIVWLEW